MSTAQYYTSTKPHAVTSLSNGASFKYDANGNMTQRVELSGTQYITYTQAWDIDNRLIAVTNTLSGQVTRYHYNADGQRVIRDNPDGTQVVYVHDYPSTSSWHSLEQNWDGIGVVTSYFSFGGQRVAMWQGNKAYWLHGDHLGSASVATSITGAVVSEMRYYPFGETRWMSGTLPTDRLFTGQRAEAGTGLYDYNARMYSPMLGRFISADTIVPRAGDSQAYNRYAYARNSPLTRVDPSGHADCAAGDNACWQNQWMWNNRWYEAHGLFWGGSGWNVIGTPRFANEGLFSEAFSSYLFQNGWKSLVPPPEWIVPEYWIGNFLKHEAVVLYFITRIRQGAEVHHFVQDGGWYGRHGLADIYDRRTGEVWEVKPNKPQWTNGTGLAQLNNYVAHIPGSQAGEFQSTFTVDLLSIMLMVHSDENQPGMLFYTELSQSIQLQPSVEMVKMVNVLINLMLLLLPGQPGFGGPVLSP